MVSTRGSTRAKRVGRRTEAIGERIIFRDYYQTMRSKYPDKIAVGAAWAGFDDRKASWGLSRYISQRCGKTLSETMKISREYYPADDPIPFLLIATWNDYEEGTAIERGSSKCDGGAKAASH